MSMRSTGAYLSVSDKSVWTIVHNAVTNGLVDQSLEQDGIESLSIDETSSSSKGHNYLTILSSPKDRKVVGVGYGKDTAAACSALEEMEVRRANRANIKAISMDMSPSYISFANNYLPHAEKVFDRFHIEALLNKAVDTIRRKEQKEKDELRKSRYLWLRNQSNLKEEQLERLNYLKLACPNIGEAHRLKELFKEVWAQQNVSQAGTVMGIWMQMVIETQLDPLLEFVAMLKKHLNGVAAYFKSKLTNGIAEGINAKIQAIKRIAKGYRNMYNFRTMIYFHLGGLEFNLPT